MKKVALSWSGGKDSLMALLALEAEPEIEISALVTTVTDPQQRISMHGIREALLDAQATALGLPLAKCRLPPAPDNESYRKSFAEALDPLAATGTVSVAFGDLFLEDVRKFREEQMRALQLEPLFPIWQTPTAELANAFVDQGYRAVLCCVDSTQLDPEFLGREYDAALLSEFPQTVDPCGERGEFHTFVHAGPRFNAAIPLTRGQTHISDARFHFIDLA